jgi:asparagine synthase (glutamine-hydrolysing)
VTDKKIATSYLVKRFMEGVPLTGLGRHLAWTSQVPARWMCRLGLELPETQAEARRAHVLDVVQQFDFSTTLAEGLLTKADRAGMGAALELRAPFLDTGVSEFAQGLPPGERVNGLTTKVFLKRFARRYLSPSVIHQRKRGLSVPLAPWLRGPLRDWALALLVSPKLETAGINPAAAAALFAEHEARKSDLARAAWTILVLSIWLDRLAEIRRMRKGAA